MEKSASAKGEKSRRALELAGCYRTAAAMFAVVSEDYARMLRRCP